MPFGEWREAELNLAKLIQTQCRAKVLLMEMPHLVLFSGRVLLCPHPNPSIVNASEAWLFVGVYTSVWALMFSYLAVFCHGRSCFAEVRCKPAGLKKDSDESVDRSEAPTNRESPSGRLFLCRGSSDDCFMFYPGSI